MRSADPAAQSVTLPAGVTSPWRIVTPHLANIVMVFAAIAIRLSVPIDANIDWLMTNCRRFLAGAHLYKDIVETNPPMAIFIYLPAAVVERFTGWPAEGVYTVMVLAAAITSALVFCRLVRPLVPDPRTWRVLEAAVLFALVVAPLSAFGEREHAALILTLPILGLAARRAAGLHVAVPVLVMTGLAAGIAPMIKPHFALGIVAAYLFMAIRRRNLLLLAAPEAVLAAAAVAVYAGLVAHFIPAYGHEVMPLLFDLYQPLGLPLAERLLSFKTLAWTASVICLGAGIRGRLFEPVTGTLVAASAGFLLVLILQGRDWPYHAYSAVALMFMAVPPAILPALLSGDPKQRVPAIAAAVAACVHLGYFTGFGYGGSGVVAPIRAAVTAPTIMSISFDLTPGHPITTQTHGTWVGIYSSRWITVNASYLRTTTHDPVRLARLERWLAYDRAVTNRDLAKRPDIVLVGLGPFGWQDWIAADPTTQRLMAGYVPLARDELTPKQRERYEGIAAFIRRDLVK